MNIPGSSLHGAKPIRPIYLAILLASAALAISACGGAGDDPAEEPDEQAVEARAPSVNVVATTNQVADIVANVGGGSLDLTTILGPDADPHAFEPTFSDVSAVVEADVVFSSGEDLDSWAEELVSQSGSNAPLVALAEAAEEAPFEDLVAEGRDHDGHGHDDHDHDDHGHDHGDLDPHWWHNPRNAAAAVELIVQELAEVAPDGTEDFRAAAAEYRAEILRLDRAIEQCFDQLGPNERMLVTDHEAFGHLVARYDLEMVGAIIPAQSTEAQASARDLSELAATVDRLGVKAVFPERSAENRMAETIAAQTGATAEYSLYADSLGPEGSDGATYLEMMAANANSIATGLSGGRVDCGL